MKATETDTGHVGLGNGKHLVDVGAPISVSQILTIESIKNKKTDMHKWTTTSLIPDKIGLTERSLRGIKWNYLGVVGRIIAQLLVQIALARMLGPDTFGIFATCALIVGLSLICIDMGLGSAVVQTKDLDDAQISNAFTMIVIAGAIGSLSLFLMAGPIASFFNSAPLKLVLQIMAPVLTIQALAVIPQALLSRDFAFKIIQIGQLLSYIISYALIGIGLAWYGAGVWSLVAAWYMQSALTFLIFFWKRPHSVKPLFINSNNKIRKFGIKILFTNIVNWITENLDSLIIGKVLGATALGLYSVSYNLVRTPANHLVTSLQAVLFPASSRAQDNLSGLQRAYLSVIAGITLIAFPVFITTAILSITIIETLFGDRWAAAATITVPLALAMAAHPMMAVAGPMLAGKGQPGTELKIQFWVALIFISMLLVASRISILAVAWTVFAIYVLRAAWITSALLKSFNIHFFRLLKALQGGILVTSVIAPIIFIIDRLMMSIGQAAGYRLLEEIIASSLIALFLLFTVPRHILSSELKIIIENIASRSKFFNESFLMRRIRV